MDKSYLLFYILSLVFLVALLIWKDTEPLNYILGILCGATINIMAASHFYCLTGKRVK